MSEEYTHGVRLDRVEAEVSTIRTEMGGIKSEMSGLKADVRGLGGVLSRIEESILRAQDKDDKRLERSRPNVVAIISILITIIFTLISGAWIVGGELGRLDERSAWVQQQLNRNEQRLWQVSHATRP